QGNDPSTVAKVRITQQPNQQGIYAGQWEFVGHKGEDKFSTFYPDHCTPTQVINSIGYAAHNQQACPQSAPQWAWCGVNAPQHGSGDYCRSADGTPFLIAGASSSSGGVNTAFPLR
ncbi:MAG: EndoU domain-containing protein, partial [Thiothrix sp.]